MGRFLRLFFQKTSFFVPVAVLIFTFLYFEKYISLFIETFLMSNPTTNEWYLQLIIIIAFLWSTGFLSIKLIADKYVPTAAEYIFFSLSFLLLLYYRFNGNGLNWNLHLAVANSNFSVQYIELALALVLFYFAFNAIGWYLKRRRKQTVVKNFLIGDDPISTQGEDLVDFSPTVGKLTDILLSDKHPKSISIGLIGSWGNGKSSVIQMTKSAIESSKQFQKNEIIPIHFLPYLNHNENEIINEFFTLLSNALSPYNGRLSNQIVDYSQKLTDLYQNKSLSNFLENHITNFSQSSACELYENINKMLVETHKKIIVFIDDLDRLNQKEILQTLKLIRNTANFTNTFFVLAMDKQYVIKRLAEKGNILDTKFVDKFFQLEIYLPEIDNSVLKQYFTTEMLREFSPRPLDLEPRLKVALSDPNLLFGDYVKNFRDVKRVVNQIKYDISLFQEDFAYLNLKDFINFTFFKLKFPQVLKQLNENRGDFLTIDRTKGTYNLIQVQKDQKELMLDVLHSVSNESINSIWDLDKYQAYNEILNDKKEHKIGNEKIMRSDKVLLIKTLAYLFGDENIPQGQDSIKFANNFQMLMQQRIFANFLKQSEFELLFTTERETLKTELLKIKQQGKEDQLIGRLGYFSTADQPKLKRIIEYVTIIYEMNALKNQYDIDIYKLIEKFAAELYDSLTTIGIAEYRKWLDENLFSSDLVSEETRIILISTIWQIKPVNELWHLDEDYIIAKTAELYDKYLVKYDRVLWEIDNFRSFNVYQGSKLIDNDKTNELLIEFWSRNDIELLCAQLTDIESFSNTSLKISETAVQIFGSKEKYIDFVKTHKDHSLPQVQEFIDLFQLLQLVTFKFALEYDFVHSSLMKERIKKSHIQYGTQNFIERERHEQVIIKITDTTLGYQFTAIRNYKEKYFLNSTIFENTFYLTINVMHEKIDRLLSDFIVDITTLHYGNPEPPVSLDVIAEGTRIQLTETDYIEFISIKPKPEGEIKYLNK
ncbi:P-loop NTPase fold protein [Flavobacterium pectinovorum]|uniref:KAP family P-loop NTPase fold protein n=1 Tax=Flavobacterium pectinovorum TaxID=29533 RepID=UPI001FAC15FE|nr:P-loop NTPase fold protein [Flavobacterium pectinovorum]MCI9846954.1 hypothetical protein [Flavobacterium pectinovorum]